MSPGRSEGDPSFDGLQVSSWFSLTALTALITGLWFVPAIASPALWTVLLPMVPAMLLLTPGWAHRLNPVAAAARLPGRLDWSIRRPVPERWHRFRYPLAVVSFLSVGLLARLVLQPSPLASALALTLLAACAFGLAVVFEHEPDAVSPVCPLQAPRVLLASYPGMAPGQRSDRIWLWSLAAVLPGMVSAWYWIDSAAGNGAGWASATMLGCMAASAALFAGLARLAPRWMVRLPGIFCVLAFNVHYWFAIEPMLGGLRSWGLPIPFETGLVLQTALVVASLYWLRHGGQTAGRSVESAQLPSAMADDSVSPRLKVEPSLRINDGSDNDAVVVARLPDATAAGRGVDKGLTGSAGKSANAGKRRSAAEPGNGKRARRVVINGDPAIRTVVIIGNGFAGMTAAFNVRRLHPQCRIVVLTRESHPTYNRTAIARILNDDTAMSSLLSHRQGWYTQHKIEVQLETEVVALDVQARTLTTASGSTQQWDRLIIAAGASAWVPPIAGFDGPGAFVMREAADVVAMRAYLRSIGAKRVAVIGAGLLGIETAQALLKFGMRVTLVSNSAGVLDRQADPMSSALVGRHLKEKGIEIVKLASVQTVVRGEDRRVVSLSTDRGVNIAADAVVCCTGARPVLDIYQAAGLATREGIVVDELMRTSVEHVFAAGDIAEFEGQRIGLSTTAMAQGEVAAASACGEEEPYAAEPPISHLKSVGIDFRSYGRVHRNDDSEIELVDLKVSGGQYRKVIVSDGRIVGAVLVNHSPLAERYALAVKHHADAKPLLARVKRGDWVILRSRQEPRGPAVEQPKPTVAAPEPPVVVPPMAPVKALSAQPVKVPAMHLV